MTPLLFTIGHSNRTLEFLIGLLQGYEIQRLVDVRTMPRSKFNPQFNRETLPQMLKVVGTDYSHRPQLGGLRHPLKNSVNVGWKNKSFRGYADYMQTAEFGDALDELIELGKKQRVAFMCAEAVPWRCHRSLISDALTVRHIEVRHIMSRVSAPKHALTSWAVQEGQKLTYPPTQLSFT